MGSMTDARNERRGKTDRARWPYSLSYACHFIAEESETCVASESGLAVSLRHVDPFVRPEDPDLPLLRRGGTTWLPREECAVVVVRDAALLINNKGLISDRTRAVCDLASWRGTIPDSIREIIGVACTGTESQDALRRLARTVSAHASLVLYDEMGLPWPSRTNAMEMGDLAGLGGKGQPDLLEPAGPLVIAGVERAWGGVVASRRLLAATGKASLPPEREQALAKGMGFATLNVLGAHINLAGGEGDSAAQRASWLTCGLATLSDELSDALPQRALCTFSIAESRTMAELFSPGMLDDAERALYDEACEVTPKLAAAKQVWRLLLYPSMVPAYAKDVGSIEGRERMEERGREVGIDIYMDAVLSGKMLLGDIVGIPWPDHPSLARAGNFARPLI